MRSVGNVAVSLREKAPHQGSVAKDCLLSLPSRREIDRLLRRAAFREQVAGERGELLLQIDAPAYQPKPNVGVIQ
jgi:hypothetical protein